MTDALHLARTEVFNTTGDRSGFPNTAVIITDGYPTQPSTLQPEIDQAQNSGIRILALGVTKKVDESTLYRLSSPPKQVCAASSATCRPTITSISTSTITTICLNNTTVAVFISTTTWPDTTTTTASSTIAIPHNIRPNMTFITATST